MDNAVKALPDIETPENRWNLHKAVNGILYAILFLCVAVNMYVLFNPHDTIFYLRLYHIVSDLEKTVPHGSVFLLDARRLGFR